MRSLDRPGQIALTAPYTNPMPPAAPTSPGERSAALDALRGFALLGIVFIHTNAFALPTGPPGIGFAGPPIDYAVEVAVIALVESKFFCLFSLLFGAGFAVQLGRAEARGERFLGRYLRRLGALALFGVLHVVFVWEGDILLVYALVGWLLLPFNRAADRWLVRWAAILLAVPLVFYTLFLALTVAGRYDPDIAAELAKGDAGLDKAFGELNAAPAATYLEALPRRLGDYLGSLALLATRVPTILAMFLLGLWAGRRGVVADPAAHRRLLRAVERVGLGVGMVLVAAISAVFFAGPTLTALAAVFFNQAIAGPVLSLGYAAAFLLLAVRFGPRPLAPFAAVGRMGLTNYVAHSAILTVIFTKPWLGFTGGVRPVWHPLIALCVFAALAAASALWLRLFYYGPLEYLWRAATYWKWPGMRRHSSVVVNDPT